MFGSASLLKIEPKWDCDKKGNAEFECSYILHLVLLLVGMLNANRFNHVVNHAW